jgi:hypothetical protein
MLKGSYSGALPLFPAFIPFITRPEGNVQQIAGAYERSGEKTVQANPSWNDGNLPLQQNPIAFPKSGLS